MTFDRNGDGKLSKDEVPERMQGLLDRGDTNHDGVLTKEEIVKLAAQQNSPGGARQDEGRRPDFMRFDPLLVTLDTDHDGIISAAEITNATVSLLKLDKDGDGQLTQEEVSPNRGRGRSDGDRAREPR